MDSTIDYQELIDELKNEVGTGSLQDGETIQILRDTKADKTGYKPIVDWYYSKEAMEVELTPSDADDKEDLKETMLLREQYEKDQPNLENITVEECLKEMMTHTAPNTKKGKKGDNPFF